MKFQIACFYTLVLLVYKGSSESSSGGSQTPLDVDKVNEIKDEVLQRVMTSDDTILQAEVKSKLVDYLVDTTIEDYERKNARPRQEEAEGAAEVPENQNVYNGVRRILQNVFSGNLVGVIQESVSIRAPGRVQTFFADIMGAFFGSNAVKGAGTIGLPQPTNATMGLNATDNASTTISSSSAEVDEDDENDNILKE